MNFLSKTRLPGTRTCLYFYSRSVSSNFVNKNPRNLEGLGCASRTEGWQFQYPRRDFYYKCVHKRQARHICAEVTHSSGSVVASASTEELAINSKLYSCVDVSAAKNLGRVLAQRLHEIGISEIFFDFIAQPPSTESVQQFTKALLDSGIALKESFVDRLPEPIGIRYNELTVAQKHSLYPSLIGELRATPDWGLDTYPYSLRPVGNGLRQKRNRHQILTKVRQGMIWDPFYHRIIPPEHMAHWQTSLKQMRTDEATQQQQQKSEPEPSLSIPQKWKY